eukprot:NODE_577_length_1791_cov_68.270433_g568_i0.p1 GENE.NODE_577_length_1791_cov_68.270433_g568_i0~~NODE_577_length_1791_cov_68.270433_g568_i0.p1  ORF type:complete len:570 (+),score=189.50 NODE_577_length_1791_cov_68.270433_g568_i0:175-1710(+)
METTKKQLAQQQDDLNAETEKMRSTVHALESEFEKLQSVMDTSQLEVARGKLGQDVADLEARLAQVVEARAAETAGSSGEVDVHSAKEARRNELTKQITVSKETLAKEKTVPKDDGTLPGQIAVLEVQLEERKQQRQQTEANRRALKEKSQACVDKIDHYQNHMEELAAQLQAVTEEINQLQAAGGANGSNPALSASEESTLQQLQKKLASENQLLEADTKRLGQLKAEYTALSRKSKSNNLQANAAWLKEMELVRRAWAQEKATLEQEIQAQRERLKQLQQQKESKETSAQEQSDKDKQIRALKDQLAAMQATLSPSTKIKPGETKLATQVGAAATAGVQGTLTFSRFRASCYTATRSRDTITVSSGTTNPTVAICSRLLHAGRHTWKMQTNTGNLKCGVGMHSITVLNSAGQQISWVLTRSGELRHAGANVELLTPLSARDVVTVCLDMDAVHDLGDGQGPKEGVLSFSVNDAPMVPAVVGLAQHAPLIPIAELYEKGDSVVLTGYTAT